MAEAPAVAATTTTSPPPAAAAAAPAKAASTNTAAPTATAPASTEDAAAVLKAASSGEAAKWPEDWREQIAGADDKTLKRLQRYNAPSDALKALTALQAKISAGEMRSRLAKDAKPEDIQKWREENGIPEAPDKYDIEQPKGIEKTAFEKFLKASHDTNATPEQVKAMTEFWVNERAEAAKTVQAEDVRFANEQRDTLTAEWGKEYDTNIARVQAVLGLFPDEVRQLLVGARLADGRPLSAHAGVLKAFAQISREIDPAGTLTSFGTESQQGNVDSRIEQIEKVIKTNRSQYNNDEKMQDEYRRLLAAREKMKAREAA